MPTLPSEIRPVTDIPAADPTDALAHFEALLRYETDCWDVHAALAAGHPGFVVLDVRSPDSFVEGHASTIAIWPPMRRTRCSWSTATARTATARIAPRYAWRVWAAVSRR
jgi:hypothetical protein